MTEQEQKTRVFKYGDQSWEDPGPQFSNEDVRQQLTTVFPELARADIVTTDLEDGRQQVEFIKRAGTKGNENICAKLLDKYVVLPSEADRQKVLDFINETWQGRHEGDPVILYVQGDFGTGKTRLLQVLKCICCPVTAVFDDGRGNLASAAPYQVRVAPGEGAIIMKGLGESGNGIPLVLPEELEA